MNRASIALTLIVALAFSAAQAANAATPEPTRQAAKQKRQGKKPARAKRKARPNPVFRPIQDDPALPRVLLIGDSISMGYTLPVRRLLAGKANVHRIPINGGDTARGLEQLDHWLGEKPWDVIHFNWGLHDLKRLRGRKLDSTGTQVRSSEAYAKNLDQLVARLEKSGATLIWATTTPVPAGSTGRLKGDDVRYNEAAAAVIAKHGVKVNDLYGFIMPKLAEAQRPRNVHFTNKGSNLLGEQVAKAITAALDARAASSPASSK